MENKQAICDALCEALKLTDNAGTGNKLMALKYMPNGKGTYSETVRPLFADGTGAEGYYDINVSCDSGTAMITDIVNQFVRRMW